MEPIKLVNIFTKRVDDDCYLDDLVTEYNIIYDSETGEIPIGLKIISSCQYDQSSANENWRQVLEYIKEDERRMNDYGHGWYMFGIQAVATLHFPMRDTESSIIQKIKSPGLYGINSDSEEYEKKDIEVEELLILFDMLKQMHVDVPDNFVCELGISGGKMSAGNIRDEIK